MDKTYHPQPLHAQHKSRSCHASVKKHHVASKHPPLPVDLKTIAFPPRESVGTQPASRSRVNSRYAIPGRLIHVASRADSGALINLPANHTNSVNDWGSNILKLVRLFGFRFACIRVISGQTLVRALTCPRSTPISRMVGLDHFKVGALAWSSIRVHSRHSRANSGALINLPANHANSANGATRTF